MSAVTRIATSSPSVRPIIPGIPAEAFAGFTIGALRQLEGRALEFARGRGVDRPLIQRVEFCRDSGRGSMGVAFSIHDVTERQWVFVRFDRATGAASFSHVKSDGAGRALFAKVPSLAGLGVSPEEASRIARADARTQHATWNRASISIDRQGKFSYEFYHSADGQTQPMAQVSGRTLTVKRL